MDMIKDVEDFHLKFDHGAGEKPRVLPHDLFEFRHKFHLEEITEYADEQKVIENEVKAYGKDHDEDIIIGCLDNQLDALVDAAWVILGTAEVQFGANRFREAWRRVVVANMAKVRSDQNEEGSLHTGRDAKFDIVKPPGWVAPSHKDLVSDYTRLINEE